MQVILAEGGAELSEMSDFTVNGVNEELHLTLERNGM